ncbi:50S ribosomal protein L7/L12-serine acetyltransferase [Gilliamella sp. App4-10]|uniref:50S ribosomal protein L7/L12-serine acetyltransferase n=1 Tax=Gilliamella sp. App4-10 TaxID=3120231 RepID=UPI00080DCB5F|nr:50S ribosomal protein L7/L12-serine acetyltransferase [Gilliamella apicola]OCG19796.1 hypothetical protein A9G23_08565 [Gilliamella apicola]
MNNTKQASIYVNKHISLQPPAKELAAELYRVIDFNRDYFSQFMAWPKFVIHPKDTADFLDSCLAKHQNNQSKNYVIMLNNHAVGMLSFNQIDQNNKTAYLGYWLDSRVQGQGVMSQAINALTKYYATKRIIKRFVIKCSVENRQSNEVAKRCGFSYEGTLKQAEYLNDTFYDQHIYSLISTYL